MNYIPKKIIYFLCCTYLFMSACANMVTPSGGLKDIDAPKIIKSEPPQNAKNFNEKNIEITFDEYINLKDIQNEFIISPSNIDAEVKKDGKKLKIKLSDSPKENTTYILNFGNAISDYTENNISQDFKFIFSTGDSIDSLSLSGNILNSFNLDPVKNVIICLYTDILDDSIVYKRKPDYTVRTDETGKFRFTNLKANKYKLFAIKEENNNKLFDTQEEEIAFSDTIINLKQNAQFSNIKLFKEKASKRKLVSKDISYQKVELIFNKENNIKLIDLHPKIDTVIYSSKKDTINIYYTENADSTAIYLMEENKIDTIKVKFAKSLKKRELNIAIDPKINNNKVLISTYDLFEINKIDSIQLFEDSIPVKFTLEKIKYNKYVLNYKFDIDKKYYIIIADSAYISFQKNYNKKIKSVLTFMKPEDYGTLSIKPLANDSIIYELLNDKNEIINTNVNVKETIVHTNLNPGTYRIRMIYDANKNYKWDTGNYLKNIQPEKIEYYINPIKIRANWDLEIVLTP